MKIQTLDLNRLGLSPITVNESQTIEGGGILDAIAGLAGVIVSQAAIVVGVMTFQPELVYAGAVGTGLSLELIDR
jgi:hypothetical protein